MFEIPGKGGKDRPRKSYKETLKQDLKVWNLEEHNMVHDRTNWRRNATRKRKRKTFLSNSRFEETETLKGII